MNRADGAKTLLLLGEVGQEPWHMRESKTTLGSSLLPPLQGFQRQNSSHQSRGVLFLSQEKGKSTDTTGRREEGTHTCQPHCKVEDHNYKSGSLAPALNVPSYVSKGYPPNNSPQAFLKTALSDLVIQYLPARCSGLTAYTQSIACVRPWLSAPRLQRIKTKPNQKTKLRDSAKLGEKI